jgi:molybdopterin-guanine dinucleotide biosynthesis protein A
MKEKDSPDISGIVLAGGKSVRLGRDKLVETIGDTSLLQRVLSCLGSFNRDIIIVTAGGHDLSRFADHPRLKIVNDIYPGKGSLGGVYTGLTVSKSLHNLVVGGDMPFLNRDFLSYMMQLSAEFDVVIPRLGNAVEPLHAIYSRACLAPIENLFRQNNLRIIDFLHLVRVRYIEAGEIDRFDPNHLSFFNINTEADLKTARELAARGERRP